MTIKQEMIPDGSGTIGLSGLESLVDRFLLKHEFIESETKEIALLKTQLRTSAVSAIREAVKAGATRAFLRASRRGGVLVSMPDFEKPANRPVFNDDKLGDLAKLGGLEKLGLTPEEVFDEERTESGEVIELRGPWVAWFREHYGSKMEKDPNIKYEDRKSIVVRRLKAAVREQLEAAAAAGSTIAQLLLEKGYKEPMIRAERE